MTQGIKISKSEKDVKTEKDENLIYSSLFETMKIIDAGVKTYKFSDNGNNSPRFIYIDKPHILNYCPAVIMYYKIDDGTYSYMPYYSYGTPPDGYYREWRYLSTPDTVKISYWNYTGTDAPDWTGKTFYFKYYIFVNKSKGD